MRGADDNRFSPADVKRAIKAARDAGQSVAALDFPKQGGFRLVLGEPAKIEGVAQVNEWDDLLAS